jgi:hypothetical protein
MKKKYKKGAGFAAMVLCWLISINTLVAHNKPVPPEITRLERNLQDSLVLPASEAEIIGLDFTLFEPLSAPQKTIKKLSSKKNTKRAK